MNNNTTTNTTTTNSDAPAMVCPICGKQFYDVTEYANHLMRHSDEDKKRKAEEEKKARETQRSKDIDELVQLNAEYKAANKRLNDAIDAYDKKYGLVFSYADREKFDLSDLFPIFRWLC